jgi:hypothetical protein
MPKTPSFTITAFTVEENVGSKGKEHTSRLPASCHWLKPNARHRITNWRKLRHCLEPLKFTEIKYGLGY